MTKKTWPSGETRSACSLLCLVVLSIVASPNFSLVLLVHKQGIVGKSLLVHQLCVSLLFELGRAPIVEFVADISMYLALPFFSLFHKQLQLPGRSGRRQRCQLRVPENSFSDRNPLPDRDLKILSTSQLIHSLAFTHLTRLYPVIAQ